MIRIMLVVAVLLLAGDLYGKPGFELLEWSALVVVFLVLATLEINAWVERNTEPAPPGVDR